jgi:hypothetical protein
MWAVVASVASAVLLFWPPILVWLLSARRTSKAEAQAREHQAYADLLVASVGMASRAHTLLTALKLRSGLAEGLAVTLGLRPPVDPLALHDWIDHDYARLMDAWSRVWVYGSAEGVRLGNRLVDGCGALMELSGSATGTSTIRGKARHLVLGISLDELTAEWQRRMRSLAVARRDFTDYVRTETGRPAAALFSTDGAAPPPPAR